MRAGGSLHFICEAINPWLNRPLATRGTARADVGVASGNGLLIDRRRRRRRRACSTSATSWARTMGDFTHRDEDRAATGSSNCPTPSCCTAAARAATGCSTTSCCNRWHFMLKNYQGGRTLLAIAAVPAVHEPLQLLDRSMPKGTAAPTGRPAARPDRDAAGPARAIAPRCEALPQAARRRAARTAIA